MVFSETELLMVENIDFSAKVNMKKNMENPSAEKTRVSEDSHTSTEKAGVSQDSNTLILQKLASIDNKIDSMGQAINKKIEDLERLFNTKVDEIGEEMETEINCIKSDVADITRKMEAKEKFDLDRSVIVRGMPVIEGEDEALLQRSIERMFSRMGPSVNVQIKHILRFQSKTPLKPGIVKVELFSLDQKICVLRAKASLRRFPEYRSVFVSSSKSHVERLCELNFKTILGLFPEGKNVQITRSGRIVEKSVDKEKQATALMTDNKRKRVGSTPPVINPESSRWAEQAIRYSQVKQNDEMVNMGTRPKYPARVISRSPEASGLGTTNFSESTPVPSKTTVPLPPPDDLRLSFTPKSPRLHSDRNTSTTMTWNTTPKSVFSTGDNTTMGASNQPAFVT